MDVKYIILMQKYTQPCQSCIKVLYAHAFKPTKILIKLGEAFTENE